MEQRTSLTEIIEYIDPGSLSYQDWVNVGMALKLEGYPVSVWDQWSQKDFQIVQDARCRTWGKEAVHCGYQHRKILLE